MSRMSVANSCPLLYSLFSSFDYRETRCEMECLVVQQMLTFSVLKIAYGVLMHIMIITQSKSLGIHRLLEGPGITHAHTQ